jgi:hypothetical protein
MAKKETKNTKKEQKKAVDAFIPIETKKIMI